MKLTEAQAQRLRDIAALAGRKGLADARGRLLMQGRRWLLCLDGQVGGEPSELSIELPTERHIDQALNLMEGAVRNRRGKIQ